MLNLRPFLIEHNLTQASIARQVGISKAAMTNLLKGEWPVKRNKEELKQNIIRALESKGLSASQRLFEVEIAPAELQPDGDDSRATNQKATLESLMLLRKQTLTQAARRHFSLFRDPFAEEALQSADDVFLTPDIRYVREALWFTARFGGFVAVVGESGAGKSTLRRDLLDRLSRENESVIVIEPYILGMEDNDRKGKTLKAASIAEAIIHTLNPLERPLLSPEARYRQLHRLLRESSRAGNRHVLIIEEAHSLPPATLKHLKRFWELEDGFKKLLGIILVGQPELRLRLSETNPEVREVVQRIELIELRPLDNELDAYLSFKFQRLGKNASDIITEDGISALRDRLTVNAGKRGKVSLLYPLACNNFLTAAMNLAAELGIPQVDADVVKEV